MNLHFLIISGTLLFTFFQFFVLDAYAYLDPGTGSIIIQALIGTLAGTAITLKVYWHKIKKNLLDNRRMENKGHIF
jgi:uncharacterized membrane protein